MTVLVEEHVEFITQNGQRVALFDEHGALYVVKPATKSDRKLIFNIDEDLLGS